MNLPTAQGQTATTVQPTYVELPPGGSLTYDSEPWIHDAFGLAFWLPVLLIILLFRVQIGNLIDRVKSVSTPLGSFEASQRQEPPPKVDVDKPPVVVDASLEDALSTQDQVEGSTIQPDPSPEPTDLDKITHERDAWALAWEFERLYGQLYGSQVTLLQAAARQSGGSLGPAMAGQFYQLAVDRGYKQDYDTWVKLVIESGLLTQTKGVDGMPLLWITQKGRDFVAYAAKEHGADIFKPF